MIARPLPFVWPYALIFWVVMVWAFFPESILARRARKGPTPPTDLGSTRLILGATQLAMVIALVAAFFVRPFPSRLSLFWVGMVLLVAGSALRRHCFRVLGQWFTYAVMVVNDQRVVDRGAYRWVRHPSYTGGLLMFTGIGLALGNWVSVAVLTLTTIAVYAYRVKVEERALIESIGEPYRTYMASRKRFIPFVV